MLKLPYEIWIGARYAGLSSSRGRGGRRDRFVSFVAASSMAGIGLGVAALIVVLSVMNGFQKEVRDRMLSVLPHIEIFVPGPDPVTALEGWQTLVASAKRSPAVLAGAPFVAAQGMLMRGQSLRGVQVRGIDPVAEKDVSDAGRQMVDGRLTDLKPGTFGIVLGQDLADMLQVRVGQTVMMLAPAANVSPAGFSPRMRQFTVVGTFRSGHFEYDSSLAFVDATDAAKVFRDGALAGVRLRVDDMHRAPEIAQSLVPLLPNTVMVADWSRNNRTWFAAVQTEKRMMFLILTLIVAVAAFNLLSFGATPAEIARIFLVQGAMIGVLGTLTGVVGGTLIALNVDVLVPAIERFLGVQFLPREIYFISALPSDVRLNDVMTIGLTSLVMSLVATLYPSWRASRLQPAQVLRHD